MRSHEELQNQLAIFKQLLTMSQRAYCAARDAECAALRSKLEADKSVAELKVRIELVEQELGIDEATKEMDEYEKREAALADEADTVCKQVREERTA